MSAEELTSSEVDVVTLEVQAKQAYEQNRAHEALGLVNKVLAVQPGNETAVVLQSAISGDIDRTLNEVRALMEERQSGSAQARLCSAEVMLLKVLDIDPQHKGANTLLQATRSMSKNMQSGQEPVVAETDLPFTADHTPADANQKGKRSLVPVLLVATAVLTAGGLVLARHSSKGQPAATVAPRHPASPNVQTVLPVPEQAQSVPSPAPEPQPPVNTEAWLSKPAAVATPSVVTAPARVVVIPSPAALSIPTPATPAKTPAAAIVVKTRLNSVPLMQSGTLAVSSPVATDIYEGEQFLGSTPTTLQLSPGSHTLEYRHANLRKTMTHVIKSDDTSSALITFDVVVQINAKPWAQVYLEGSERQALGQTPLSDVRVPIGRVVVFENPKFPAKTYRITGKETSIQMVFP